jgi:hypothetical protein
MNLPNIILTIPPELPNRTEILVNTQYPYVTGKVVKLKPEQAEDYEARSKTLDYAVIKIKGYNIFIIHAGFFKKPNEEVDEKTIKYAIAEMAEWYSEKIMPKSRHTLTFKIKR